MSDDAYGATVAKRRLSRRLYELRRDSGHTANHVCDLLDWGRGKVGRFEANHWKRPEMSDIRDLLRVYGVDEAAREELEQLAIQARARPWWRDYSDVFENEFPGFENDAVRIRVFMPLVLPGLLQTQDYTEALFARRLQAAHLAEAGPGVPPAAAADSGTCRRHRSPAGRGHRRGVPDVPVGHQGRAARADPASRAAERQPARGVAHPALRRRAAPGHVVHGQHFRLRRRRAQPRLPRDRRRDPRGE